MGYHNVDINDFHGRRDGACTQPLYEIGNLNGQIYYAAHIKAIDIHIDSRKKRHAENEGHAEGVSNQLLWL